LKGISDVESGKVKYTQKSKVEESIIEAKEEEIVNEVQEEVIEDKGSWFDGIFKKTKEWFEAEPDSEF